MFNVQSIIVCVCVAASVAYAIWRTYKSLSKPKADCCSDCHGCNGCHGGKTASGVERCHYGN